MVAKEELILSRRLFVNQLYDLYCPLLTEKQREAWELHEFSDLSLSETAEKLGASRQAVHDLISRSREKLEELETLLGFHRREEGLEEEIRSLRAALEERRGRTGTNSRPEEDHDVRRTS
ncbi:MAG: sigma factor-like helix-turn-helix DNA-binding protein [Aminobacteriaceae bacterium]|jgi:hypothetical protein